MPYSVDLSPESFNGLLNGLYKTLEQDALCRKISPPEKLFVTDYHTLYSCVLQPNDNGTKVYFYRNSPIIVYDLGNTAPRNLVEMRDLLLKWNDDTVQPLDRTVITFCYCLCAGLVPKSKDEVQHFCVEALSTKLLQQAT
jgi:hypothetical protein